MNDVNKFSNLQVAMENMSALQNLVSGMSAVQIPSNILPEIMEQMKMAQKVMSSPAYQAMVEQQEILNKSSLPVFNFKIQESFHKFQELMNNRIFLSALITSQNFLSMAEAFQNAYENFFTVFNKLNPEEQKQFTETLRSEPSEKEINQSEKDISDKVKKNFIDLKKFFTKLAISAKNLLKNNIYPTAKKVLNTISDYKTVSMFLDEIKNVDNLENIDVDKIDIALALNALDNLRKIFW